MHLSFKWILGQWVHVTLIKRKKGFLGKEWSNGHGCVLAQAEGSV